MDLLETTVRQYPVCAQWRHHLPKPKYQGLVMARTPELHHAVFGFGDRTRTAGEPCAEVSMKVHMSRPGTRLPVEGGPKQDVQCPWPPEIVTQDVLVTDGAMRERLWLDQPTTRSATPLWDCVGDRTIPVLGG